MFKVVLNDGQTEMPDDDIYYIIGKEGVFLKKKLGVMESLAPVSKISILESVTASAQMHINPIPGKWIVKVMGFFKAVYAMHRSEAIVLLFYNEETGKHKIVPPTQKVAGASCDYDKGIILEGWTMIGTIHSHGNMSAFHSGTDDTDEEHFDGLHITLGDLDEDYPSISSSIVANGYRAMVAPEDYIDDLILMSETNEVENKPVRTVYRWVDNQLVEDKEATSTYSYSWKKFDRRYDVLCHPHERVFNKKWLDMVEKGTYTYKSWRGGQWQARGGKWPAQSGYGIGGFQHWGHNFDANAWEGVKTGTRVPPQNVGPAANIKPLEFPPHTPEGEYVPCSSCVHRMCKLTDEIEDEDYNDTFYCKKCGQIVKDVDEGEPQCLECKTDDHLVLLDEKELRDNFELSDDFNHMFEKDTQAPIENSPYVTCKSCGNGFHIFEEDATCPFCYAPVMESYSKETELDKQQNNDAGEFLSWEEEIANEAALAAAFAAR